jgi:Mce-associated membrane protein
MTPPAGHRGQAGPIEAMPEAVSVEQATPEPATPEPVRTEPATPEPVTPEPATADPAAPQPVMPEPATAGSTPPDPVPLEPAASDSRRDRTVRRLRASPPLAVSLAVFVVAVACAAWFGWSWHSAASAGPPAYSQARDRVLADGEQAVQNFNTLDYRHVGQGIQLWLQSSAGALHSEVLQGRTQFEQEVRQAKTVTTARVLDGAVTALNTRAGTASIIVALQITVLPAQGAPVTKQNRLQAQLTRTAAGWRLTEIGQVPVGGSTTGG